MSRSGPPEARPRRLLLVATVVGAAAVVAVWVAGRGAPPSRRAERTGPEASVQPGGGSAEPAPAVAPPAAGSKPTEEWELTERLRQLVDADPRGAVDLAREGQRRFPEGEFADERAWLQMRALVHLNEIAPARDEAVAFFRRFPQSPYGSKVSRLTGVRPRPTPAAP
jgi:hypothetical protein